MRDNLISRLRRKPKHVRDNIAFGVASGVTGLVLLVWFVTVPGDLLKREGDMSGAPEAFHTLREQFNQQLASVKDSIPDSATSTDSSVVAPGSPATTTSLLGGREVTIMPVSASSTPFTGTTTSTTSQAF